ncbi:DUF2431 domain-containing protein [Quillaja saponaria]|uniref:DUF2431 domain-containing protein n=1 Tax=Quillaja saponaria TaxID=32244 RepID=A0AAD7LUQ5_QUISA|nr:DUF2431 domain-containing protein [Quillaja saponaria]
MFKKERRLQHYTSSQKILLVGEGDFSFSACLARAFDSANNMVATSLHSKDTLYDKHWSCESHLEELERKGCLVLHEVDVYVMDRHPTLKKMKFDVIIFNFPHAGHFSCFTEKDTELIEMHRELLRAFFKSASKMLTDVGEVHVAHRDDYPYYEWKLENLAASTANLILKEKVLFCKKDYPGYHNKRGSDIKCNQTFPLRDCFTFKFTRKENIIHLNEIGDKSELDKGIVGNEVDGVVATSDDQIVSNEIDRIAPEFHDHNELDKKLIGNELDGISAKFDDHCELDKTLGNEVDNIS